MFLTLIKNIKFAGGQPTATKFLLIKYRKFNPLDKIAFVAIYLVTISNGLNLLDNIHFQQLY
jgi:hypothetical protein